jgi:hypothetical protein
MDIPTVISGFRLAESLIPEQKSTSEKRRELYESVAGQEISVTPELGDRVSLQLRNCALNEDDGTAYITIAVHDPNRSVDLFQLETDFRFHYRQQFLNNPRELGNPLVWKFHFIERGPDDYKIELQVNSDDPPTIQLVFERVEATIAQIHTEYNGYLRSLYEEYNGEFEASKSFEDGEMQYDANSELEPEKLIPQPGEHDFSFQTTDETVSPPERIQVAHYAYAYIEDVVLANAGGEDYFVFK